MTISERITQNMSGVATGNPKKRAILTPVMPFVFVTITFLFILVPVWLGGLLKISLLIFQPVNLILSVVFFVPGAILFLWTLVDFAKSKGTPAPINLPKKLITSGPYAYSRNPMIGGIFMMMFALGFYLGSPLMLFVFTSLYMLIHIKSLSKVEEPELKNDLGKNIEYTNQKSPDFSGGISGINTF